MPEWLCSIGYVVLAVVMIGTCALILFMLIGGAITLIQEALEDRREKKHGSTRD